jgi:serine/threonine-protein kinase
VRALNGQRFAGYDNWRLPTLEEALSLMSAETRGEFHLDPVFDAHGAPFLWTADHDAEGRGWVVYYLDGFASVSNPTFNAYVRAVRSN